MTETYESIGVLRITYRKVFWRIWRADKHTDWLHDWIKLPFRFWFKTKEPIDMGHFERFDVKP